jgi:hypothetical protein
VAERSWPNSLGWGEYEIGRRDAIITGLARNDPASASVLSQLLTQCREAVRQAGLDSVVAPEPGR